MATKTLHLSIVDQASVRCYIRCLNLFPFPDPGASDSAVQVLEDALQTTLAQFPYLAGTVGPAHPVTGKLEVKYTDAIPPVLNSGLFSIKYMMDCCFTYSDLKASGAPPKALCGKDFAPKLLINHPGIEDPFAEGQQQLIDHPVPVLAVQATFIPGGLVMGWYVHHSVIDGAGMLQMYSFFTNCVRKHGTPRFPIPVPTNHSQFRLELDDHATPFTDGTLPTLREICTKDTLKLPPPPPAPLPYCTGRLFSIPASRLNDLRVTLCELIQAPVSIYTVLGALVWIHVTRARAVHLPYDAETSVGTGTEQRKNLTPPLASDYAGNMVFYTMATMPVSHFTAEKLVTTSTLAPAAKAMHVSIMTADSAWLRTRLNYYATLADIRDLRRNLHFSFGTDIFITSWQHFGADIEWSLPGTGSAAPEFIRKPYSAEDGGVIIMPRSRKLEADGSDKPYEVLVQLAEADMDRLLMEEGGLSIWADTIVE